MESNTTPHEAVVEGGRNGFRMCSGARFVYGLIYMKLNEKDCKVNYKSILN